MINRISNPLFNSLVQRMPGTSFFSRFLPALVTIFFVIGAVIFVFMMILGGIQWISSGGDKVAYESAKQKVTNAVVGIVILLSLFAFINIVELFFGVNITLIDFNTISL